jgi:ribonuclease P protein component
MRFPRKQSINQSEDFLRIRKTGQAKAGRFVIVSTLADPALPTIRAAFVTSKRAAKKAHDRNRIRRRLRVFRHMLKSSPIPNVSSSPSPALGPQKPVLPT